MPPVLVLPVRRFPQEQPLYGDGEDGESICAACDKELEEEWEKRLLEKKRLEAYRSNTRRVPAHVVQADASRAAASARSFSARQDGIREQPAAAPPEQRNGRARTGQHPCPCFRDVCAAACRPSLRATPEQWRLVQYMILTVTRQDWELRARFLL